MKVTRKIIEIDPELCDGCGQCVPSCAEGALQIVDGKARLVAEKYCDGLGACLGECPTGALQVIERESEDFDEAAVHQYLQEKAKEEKAAPAPLACACPSALVQSFDQPPRAERQPVAAEPAAITAALSHWPIKINLIPPTAPFLKKADIMVLADCAAVAYANFHKLLLPGKVVLMGCPKFDDVDGYIDKIAEIFRVAEIHSVTTVIMDVPCCQGMSYIVDKAMAKANKKIPHEEIVIGVRGQIQSRDMKAA
jgi:NAD-dependent dihydropyrimidine dehydrogenase PreA subunit